MANVPSYVKLEGYKGRSQPPLPNGRLTWVTTEAELESDSGQDLRSLAERLHGFETGGQAVELELMELETDPRNPQRFWEEAGERRALVDGVSFDEARQELVVQLRLVRG